MTGRHAKRRSGRHLPRPPATPLPMDPTDQLALNQAGWMPPPGQIIYHVHTPKPGLPAWARWTIAGSFALGGGLVVLFTVLALALSMAPGTAEATDPPPVQSRVESVTEVPGYGARVVVTRDRIKIRAEHICPAEDSCRVSEDSTGNTIVIERVNP